MIGLVGLNHESAPVEVRERFVFDEPEIARFIQELRQQEPFDAVVVLSTCNRTEIYFSSPKPCSQRDIAAVQRFLCSFKGVGEQREGLFYAAQEQQAVSHLFRVASGLDSMVLGENQILGQVKTAYHISASRKHTGAVLNRLFHKCFEVGKSVRSETGINEGASSVGYAAVELAGRIFSNLEEHPALLIGAGETGELVLQCLARRGSRHLCVVNRTPERAQALAAKYGAEAAGFDRLEEQLLRCDIVIASISSREPLLGREQLAAVMQRRRNRCLFLIDLSVPRAVEESVKGLEEVFVYDVDDLKGVLARNAEKRQGAVNQVERIVEEHTREFFDWLSSLDLAPTITHLRRRFDSISQGELDSLRNRLPEETFRKVEEFGRFLQGKYLGLIIKNLKSLSREGRQLEFIDMVNDLFELRGGERQ
ncbi:MAG: glutamyl-tRNA reductase [Spirochaetes bacterium RBG_16_67_19]|nr:MAG: glutamyl-tRNA reductase [Spirochaetes bacterium RBG_16_67_19]